MPRTSEGQAQPAELRDKATPQKGIVLQATCRHFRGAYSQKTRFAIRWPILSALPAAVRGAGLSCPTLPNGTRQLYQIAAAGESGTTKSYFPLPNPFLSFLPVRDRRLVRWLGAAKKYGSSGRMGGVYQGHFLKSNFPPIPTRLGKLDLACKREK